MPAIGPFTITIFGEILKDATARTDLLPHQPNVDGTVAAASAWSTDPQEMPTITAVAGSITAVSNLIDGYRALHQKHVLVTDQFGRAFPNTLIMHIEAVPQFTDRSTIVYIRAVWRLLIATRRPQGV